MYGSFPLIIVDLRYEYEPKIIAASRSFNIILCNDIKRGGGDASVCDLLKYLLDVFGMSFDTKRDFFVFSLLELELLLLYEKKIPLHKQTPTPYSSFLQCL